MKVPVQGIRGIDEKEMTWHLLDCLPYPSLYKQGMNNLYSI